MSARKIKTSEITTKSLALTLALVLLATAVFPIASAALSAAQIKAFNLGIYYYNTEESAPVCSASISLSGSDNEQQIFNFLVANGFTPAQAAGVTGNIQTETAGTFNPQIYQGDGKLHANPPGKLGWGIVQWTPPTKITNYAKSINQPSDSLSVQLQFLVAQLNGTVQNNSEKAAGDLLKATTTVQDATVAFLAKYERAADHSPTGKNAKERTAHAEAIFAQYGGVAATTSSTVNPSTGCGSGAVAGSIVQTALNYAWPDRGHGPAEADAKPSYQTDMPKYNGSTGDTPFADCGVFVSTVMVASGADKNYPKRSTTVQETYLKTHPELYQQLPDPTDTSSLQPGDILVNSVHTYIFVGKQSAGYNSVGASLGQHVPQASNFYGGFQLFRPISSGASSSDSSQS